MLPFLRIPLGSEETPHNEKLTSFCNLFGFSVEKSVCTSNYEEREREFLGGIQITVAQNAGRGTTLRRILDTRDTTGESSKRDQATLPLRTQFPPLERGKGDVSVVRPGRDEIAPIRRRPSAGYKAAPFFLSRLVKRR